MPFSLSAISKEVGFASLVQSTRDAKLLCLQRFLRFFAFGASALILVLFMSAAGIKDSRIGLFMTLTLLGDVVLSFLLTLFADKIGRRRILTVGCIMMVASGLVFTLTQNFWFLLLASVVGVISPSGNEIGPFRAIEESTLAQICPKENRSDVFTWYNLIGTAGLALGQVMAGWMVQLFSERLNWEILDSYRTVWVLYAFLGVAKLAATVVLTKDCEAPSQMSSAKDEEIEMEAAVEAEGLLSSDEEASDEESTGHEGHPKKTGSSNGVSNHKPRGAKSSSGRPRNLGSKIRGLLPEISSQSKSIVSKLCILFAIDSFASGIATLSWLSYFFSDKFNLAAGFLGTLFFITSIAAAASNLVAASLARRIGLIKTMVFTHLPSAICLMLIPLPSNQFIAMALLIARSSTSTMDRAPRQAFLAAAVLDHERTAVMGVVNVAKTLAQSAGPWVTGYLADIGKIWIALVMAGALKAMYDLIMLKMFVSARPREEQEEERY